ncbi:MAG TPA: hypothetical protein VE262_14285 [Blastocatellia bacterium]|nr:hypothetical protein [Blastocatellia bacterium]
MKRPLLIAILLLIALSAAPACSVKHRPEAVTKPQPALISYLDIMPSGELLSKIFFIC